MQRNLFKILALPAALLLLCVALRVAVAERNPTPCYVMTLGEDVIRQEWNYGTRFDCDRKDRSALGLLKNRLNTSLFALCRPLFRLENRIAGARIVKGDAGYDGYLARVRRLGVGWDYVISPHRDGRGLNAVKDNVIVQKVD